MSATIQELRVEQLIPTKDNPRKLRPESPDFASLVESIKSVGILQPLVVRPLGKTPGGNGKLVEAFDLRAGHRRLEAAKKAGLETVPVIVRDMDDKTAMEVTVTENLQREDLSPLEESAGIQKLLDVGWSVSSIADRLGKPAAWVARRANLRKLSKNWQEALASETHLARNWPATLLERVAGLPEHMQDELLQDVQDRDLDQDVPTDDELRRHIAQQYLHTLAGAPFDLGDDALEPKAGACTSCPKRSGAAPLLFDADEPTRKSKKQVAQDRCLDDACYQRKCLAAVARKVEAVKAEHGTALPVLDSYGWRAERMLKERFPDAKPIYNLPREVKAGTANSRPAVIVNGNRAGQVLWIRISSATERGAAGVKKAKAPGKPTPLKERRELLAGRRATLAIERLRDKLDQWAHAKDPGKVDNLVSLTPHQAIALAAAFGTATKHDYHHDKDWHKFESLLGSNNAGSWLAQRVLGVLHTRLRCYDTSGARERLPEARRVAAIFNVDFDELEAAAAQEIPEPQSWANLNADGTPKGAKTAAAATKSKTTGRKAAKV